MIPNFLQPLPAQTPTSITLIILLLVIQINLLIKPYFFQGAKSTFTQAYLNKKFDSLIERHFFMVAKYLTCAHTDRSISNNVFLLRSNIIKKIKNLKLFKYRDNYMVNTKPYV